MQKLNSALSRLIPINLAGTLLVLLFSRPRAPSWDATLFATALLISPILPLFLVPARFQQKLGYSGLSIAYWFLVYVSFVHYQDRPWFDQRSPNSCDGPCFGWYTFEFEPPYQDLLGVAIAGLLTGLGIYAIKKLFLNRT